MTAGATVISLTGISLVTSDLGDPERRALAPVVEGAFAAPAAAEHSTSWHPADPEATFAVDGGVLRARCDGDLPALVSATPDTGRRLHVEPVDEAAGLLVVVFAGPDRAARAGVRCADGRPEVVLQPDAPRGEQAARPEPAPTDTGVGSTPSTAAPRSADVRGVRERGHDRPGRASRPDGDRRDRGARGPDGDRGERRGGSGERDPHEARGDRGVEGGDPGDGRDGHRDDDTGAHEHERRHDHDHDDGRGGHPAGGG